MSTSNSSGCATGPLDYNRTCFNHPEFLFDLPRPGFEFLFHLQCDLGVVYPIGDGPYGNRKAITFTGGVFDGPLIQGVVLPGGADWLLTTSNGTVSMPDTRYNLKTHDGAYIYLQTRGTRTGPKDILDKLTTDPTITPDQYRFRLTMMFETGDPRYQWLNKVVAVAAAGKSLTQVVYDAYVIT
ncbi:hypothetical protein QFC22_004401 [Naganishia vaughanmartiniae]|uniref:Uncharacterized protein n=1 Tax=Naganishia vaughanmartiniae TaxID=1424756 RepID=A0ACC2X3B8_9TREE|nr:hypothetical protein QFC22_004401 [Naganishia vaughanmartiniae]